MTTTIKTETPVITGLPIRYRLCKRASAGKLDIVLQGLYMTVRDRTYQEEWQDIPSHFEDANEEARQE